MDADNKSRNDDGYFMSQIQDFQILKVPTSLSIQLYKLDGGNTIHEFLIFRQYIETLIFSTQKANGSKYSGFDNSIAR
jgi:hypothetical protein